MSILQTNGIGIAVMGCRPFTLGHGRIIEQGLEKHGDGNFYLVLGSADKPISERCPWTIEQRMQMPRNVFGKRIKIIPIRDLGSEEGKKDWVDFVRAKLDAINLKDPTDYYSGSIEDSLWYSGRFYNPDISTGLTSDHYTKDGTLRKLHIVDRNDVPISGTQVRNYLKFGDLSWKNCVHPENWSFIQETFPEQYILK
jgi:nicotinamide mononucleotide adenylyltransferase